MRRISVIILMAVAFMAGSLSLTSAGASSDDTFRVTAVSKYFEFFDVGDKGESIGDSYVFSDDVRKKGRHVGTLDGACTVTRVEPGAFHQQCLVTLSLDGRGQITTQGVLRVAGDMVEGFTTAITGGTGDYVGVSGEAHVRFVSDERTRITVVLTD